MKVIKRDGKSENVKFEKISSRVKKLTYDLNAEYVDYSEVSKKVIGFIYDGITTKELDNLAAETAASLSSIHPDYSKLASRITITRLHKELNKNFSENIEKLYNHINPATGGKAGMISDEVYKFIKENAEELDSMIIHDRDFNYDYFGFKTLEKSYLLKINDEVAETPQQMLLRVSCGIWFGNLNMIQKTYELMSNGYMTHATPTLYNAGTKRPQLSSCFLLGIKDDGDSINGIFDTLKDCAEISKNSGGIGVHVHKIRASGSLVKGTNGKSKGLIPFLKIYNETARAVDQSGRRKGSFAIYLEPWHDDIEAFIDLRKNHGKEEMRARDLFLALWTPDLFMKRIKEDGMWSLMCPNECPGLDDVYDDGIENKFTKLYEKYESEGRYRRQVKARDLWEKILEAQIETGTPYITFKDAGNNKSNQKNINTIKSSNLCVEIFEYSGAKEQAVCNLASIALNKFVEIPSNKQTSKDKSKRKYNFNKLYEVTYDACINLNRIIDINYYPTKETKRSNLKHRPIGIGVQGLADTFALLGHSFTSNEAKILNSNIFETMYFAALNASKDLAKKDGVYKTYEGSPISNGEFQFNLWGISEDELSGIHDWKKLRKEIKKYGVRNSLLIALMPTAGTSQILGNNECFEPFTSNLYKRNTLSGEYIMINKYLIQDLIDINLWNDSIRNKMIMNNGSIQNIDEIPVEIRETYKTVWELKQRDLIDMSSDRGKFICQSQSMNLFIENVNIGILNKALFYGWERGLKTGMYYLRTKPKSETRKSLGIDTTEVKEKQESVSGISCSLDNPDSCIMCGS